MLATVAIAAAVAGLAGVAARDHARARAEGGESVVEGVIRWFGRSRRVCGSLSRAQIAALPTRIYRQADVERVERLQREARASGGDAVGDLAEMQMCPICRDIIVPEDVLLRLLCLHEYHFDCISLLLSMSRQPMCPCCRHPVIIS